MGYYVSVMIGIRTGGVFSGEPDVEDMKARIEKLQEEMDINRFDVKWAMSKNLTMHKGSYVVLSGVANYWHWEPYENGVADLAKALSKEFGVEVMAMTWDEQTNEINRGVFLDGRNLEEVNENPIGQALRRII